MRTLIRTVAVASLAVLGVAAHAVAQGDFHWSGQLSPGQTIEIKGINGSVQAGPAAGGTVEVTATKTARWSDPNAVQIEVVPYAGGVTICAVYPSESRGRANSCEPGPVSRASIRNNDTVVDFVVRVPEGVAFAGRTVNGSVTAESLSASADAKTVNGSIRLTTRGTATANTVNGSINATMGRADWGEGASFKTVNGSITLTFGSALNAEVTAKTVNGSITTEFPMTVSGTFSRRSLRGTIGTGGRPLDLSTVNGSIKLLKAQ